SNATVHDIEQATAAATDAWFPCWTASPTRPANTVFFSYTTGPQTQYVDLSTAGSDYDTLIGVLEGTPGGFAVIPGGCNDEGIPGTQQSRISGLRLRASTTYTIEVGAETALAVPSTLQLKLASSPQYLVSKTADTFDGTCNADCS